MAALIASHADRVYHAPLLVLQGEGELSTTHRSGPGRLKPLVCGVQRLDVRHCGQALYQNVFTWYLRIVAAGLTSKARLVSTRTKNGEHHF